ncbi:hypothetical protein ACSHT2_22820 [Bradyrhizobium sp. PUT101]|uniref:hypothetical protein n=1 Tax=Bradyrhizobium sp. PUT101 TaxID=3447427 RepID=UPI003F84A1FE
MKGRAGRRPARHQHAGLAGHLRPRRHAADIVAGLATASKEFLSEPATATQLKETQHMTLLLQDGTAFKTFFDKQVAYWARW